MRSARRLGGAVLLVVLAASCDTTQPLQLEVQTVRLQIGAGGAAAQRVDAWDTFEDVNGNNVRDAGDGPLFLVCEGVTLPGVPDPTPISVPWPFAIQVSVLREGETEREVLTSELAATEPQANLSQYDTSVENNVTPSRPRKWPASVLNLTVDDGGTMRTFRFTNPRRLTTLNRSVVFNILPRNPLCQILQGTPQDVNNDGMIDDDDRCLFLSGYCSNGDPGVATIDGLPQPFTMELGKGDTIRVEARRGLTGPQFLSPLITRQPFLFGEIFVNGRRVNVEGSTSSSSSRGDGFAFWFTSR